MLEVTEACEFPHEKFVLNIDILYSSSLEIGVKSLRAIGCVTSPFGSALWPTCVYKEIFGHINDVIIFAKQLKTLCTE